MVNLYTLKPLPYDYGALAPFISEQQLTLHHQKHHQAYVNGANALLERLDRARREGSDIDTKAVAKELSFQVGGNKLHNLFWRNMAPAGKEGGGEPAGDIAEAINDQFGGFVRFRKEFSAAAVSVEGSGWAVFSYCNGTERLLITQVEKHNVNVLPGYPVLLVLDAWEHAYYFDYRNDRAKYVEAVWNVLNWEEVARRFEAARKKK